VLCLSPWNYPLLTAINTIIPAILAGNSIVIKHSPRTPLMANVFQKAFEEEGAPKGLVSGIFTSHEVIHSAILNPHVGFVAFTGSILGGHEIYKTVSKRFIDCTLELGGKDPAYVAADADLPYTVDCLIDGAIYNAGQSCCAIERIYVHRSVYSEFLNLALPLVKAYNLGDPLHSSTTLGPMAQPDAPKFLSEQITDAVQKGARLLCGGKPSTDRSGKGRFFEASLIADCNHNMALMKEESFGPVVGVMPVDSEKEAVGLMNDSRYGLTAAVFSKDVGLAEKMAPSLKAGTIFMNRCDFLDPELPWTGQKDSGKGVSLSNHGFRGVTRLKGYNFKI